MFTIPAACFPAVLTTPIYLEVGSYILGYNLHSPPALVLFMHCGLHTLGQPVVHKW